MADKFTTGIDLPNLSSGQAKPASSGFIRIYVRNNELLGRLPDGTEIPFNPFDNRVAVQSTTSNLTLSPESITVLCDCTSNNITITLPDPSSTYSDGFSEQIAISRSDQTANILTISPFSSELIVGQSSLDVQGGEVINLVTDGVNWYLGA